MPENPTAATAPEPSQTAHPTDKSPADFMADIVGDFTEMEAGKPAPSISRDDKGKFVKPDKPKEAAPAKPSEKPDKVEKPEGEPKPVEDDKPKEEDKPKEGEKAAEIKPVKAAELRTAYEGLKKKVKEELEPEVQRLRAKVKEFEGKPAQEAGPLLEKVKALEERNSQLEKHIEYVDFTQSKEFLTKYAQPYRDAWDQAVADFRQLKVREQTGEDETTGEPVFKSRAASEADLLQLANMDLADMDESAQKMFGASAPRAISHIETLKKLSAAKSRAEEDARNRAGEWKTQRVTEAQTRTQKLAETWTEINKSLQERFPKAFQPEEGDADDKAAHTKGFALADLMFVGEQGLTPEQIEALPSGFRDTLKAGKPLSDAQKVQLHALARLKIANHDRKVAALKKAHARIQELEKAVADYEKSEPAADKAGSSDGKVTAPKDWLESAADEIRALDK
jgi:hypothetical protein